MNLRRVPIHVVSSLDDIAAFAPADPGGHVLIFDADNTLAPQGAPLDRFGDLVNRAIDRFEALAGVERVIVLSNGPQRGVARMVARGNKPWTSRRRLGLQRDSRVVVIGDQILTDGFLAWRWGGPFLHLVIDQEGEAARQAVMRAVGKVVATILFRRRL
jgi:predicted HAD superfamily phosphohydrolase YqeG